eukprot:515909-Ditylum_brightwellii.AAC.1
MIGPEKKVPVPHKAWWSDIVQNAHLIVQYWKKKMSLQKNQQQDESIIQEIADKLGPDQDIFQCNFTQSISAQLQKAIKFRKKCCNNSYKL